MVSDRRLREDDNAEYAPFERLLRNGEPAAGDARLLADLQRGHAPAVDELSRQYRARIVRLALRFVRNTPDAEDVAQEVLLKVWRHVKHFKGAPRLWPWIARITANTSITVLRARRRRGAESPIVDDESVARAAGIGHLHDGQAPADDQAMLAQFREHAAIALQGLPPVYRSAVILVDLEQYSTKEASRSLGIPVPTVKSRAIRGRRLLRHSLAAFQGDCVHTRRDGQRRATLSRLATVNPVEAGEATS